MGVDIKLWLEVRIQEKWHVLSPESPLFPVEEDKESLPGMLLFYWYEAFERFLDNLAVWGEDVADLSEEAKRYIENKGSYYGYGVFSYDDFAAYCNDARKRFIESLSNAALFRLEKRIRRIEKHLGLLDKGRKDDGHEGEPGYYPLVNSSVEDIVERFEKSDDGVVMRFRRMVAALLCIFDLSPEDVRIFFVVD